MKKKFSIFTVLAIGATVLFLSCGSTQKKSGPECSDGNCTNGKGTATIYSNGQTIGTMSGTWKEGKLNGNGTLTTVNGRQYAGEFKDSKQNGKGTLYINNQPVYEGQWKDGKMNGKGKYTYVEGTYYIGEWKDGNRNGQGVLYNKDNSIKAKGLWKDDKFTGKN